MPNKKSAAKELRKSKKRNAANRKASENIKDLLKKNLKLIKASDKKAKTEYLKTIQALDKAAKRGVIKPNTAARRKSRLMKKINALK